MKTKFTFLFLVFLIFSCLAPKSISAEEKTFETSVNVEYKVQDTGLTLVTNTITIKNSKSEYYPKKYILNLAGINPENIKAYEAGIQLTVNKNVFDNLTKLTIDFQNATVGRGKSKTFVVSYEDKTLTQKSGEIWEITIPKLSNFDAFDEYKVVLSVPKTLGEEAYVSPEAREIKRLSDRNIYLFQKEDIYRSGITAGFGQFQVFSFSLDYHLENLLKKKSQIKVAIPPDTSTQKMYYEKIEPEPKNIEVDEDSNWLAVYELSAGKKLDVKVTGSVQIFASPRKLFQPTPANLLANTKPAAFWQSDDPEIRKTASELKSAKEIYNFVSQNLTYNYDRLKPNPIRLGAKSALSEPSNALCMEFTDLFIALARANGIPAREINGYAYSQNPELEPLSLVTDVLHSWPEYWNKEKMTWVPVDPTWGATTGGVDFFDKFDLRHFAFVIHGKDPLQPFSPGSYKLGPDPKKDVSVSFGKLPEKTSSDIHISYYSSSSFSLFAKKAHIKIVNKGATAVYDVTPEIIIGDRTQSFPTISIFPPFSKYETDVVIPYGLLGTKTPAFLKVKAYREELQIPTGKNQVIVNQLLAFCVMLISLLIYTHRRITNQKFVNISFGLDKKLKHVGSWAKEIKIWKK